MCLIVESYITFETQVSQLAFATLELQIMNTTCISQMLCKHPKKRERSKAEMTPSSLPIFELAATQFLAVNFWLVNGTIWLSISESAVTQLLVVDVWIGSDTVLDCRPLNQQCHSSWLPISELAATQFLNADLWIGGDIENQ